MKVGILSVISPEAVVINRGGTPVDAYIRFFERWGGAERLPCPLTPITQCVIISMTHCVILVSGGKNELTEYVSN